MSPLFFIIVLYTQLSLSSELAPVRFSVSAEEETLLWQKTVDAFLSKNPKAQLLVKDSLQAVFVPAPSPSAPLFILSSGIHGAEAFTGSALQRIFLQKWQGDSQKAGLLLIHILNPHGFSHFRRTNAQNVDLNRNFSIEGLPKNQAYQNMQSLLEPQTPASTSPLSKWGFFLKVSWYYLINGKRAILNTLAGQSDSPKGLYFSGLEPQAETRIVQNWILDIAQNFSTVLHIDLHTGFGERGKLHFYGSEEFRSPQQRASLKKIFPNIKVDTADDADFYPTHGDFIDWTWKALPQKTVIPMVFEFGIMDSQTLLGGMESLWIAVLENQGFHYGYANEADKQNTRRLFETLFNPQDEAWQKAVLNQGEQALSEALGNLETSF